LNADAEHQFTLREERLREEFNRRLRDTEDEYARKLRQHEHSAEVGQDHVHAAKKEMDHLTVCVEHLLWYALSVDNKLSEVRVQKRVLTDELNKLRALHESLRVLAKGCVRVVDNSEVIVTFSPVESILHSRQAPAHSPALARATSVNTMIRGASSTSLAPSLLPLRQQSAAASTSTHALSRFTVRIVAIAIIANNRFRRILDNHRAMDPTEAACVFAEAVEPNRFNVCSLPTILQSEFWVSPTLEELEHITPELGARMLLNAALVCLHADDPTSDRSQSPKHAGGRHSPSDGRGHRHHRVHRHHHHHTSRSLSLFERIVRRPHNSISSMYRHTSSGQAHQQQYVSPAEEHIATLEHTLVAMSVSLRDAREKEISFKVKLQQYADLTRKHELQQDELRGILVRQASTIGQLETHKAKLMEEDGPYTSAAKNLVYRVSTTSSMRTSPTASHARTPASASSGSTHAAGVNTTPVNLRATTSASAVGANTGQVDTGSGIRDLRHKETLVDSSMDLSHNTPGESAEQQQQRSAATTPRAPLTPITPATNIRAYTQSSISSASTSTLGRAQTMYSHSSPSMATSANANRSSHSNNSSGFLDESQLESLDNQIESLYAELGRLSERVLTPVQHKHSQQQQHQRGHK
jgi:hypothetical protein